MSACMHVCARTHRSQKRASNARGAEFQVEVSCPIAVLGVEPRSSARVARALNYRALEKL